MSFCKIFMVFQPLNWAFENYVVPSLKDLCKVVNTEYRKYEISIESHEQMKTDTDVLKSVVSDHSERIIRFKNMLIPVDGVYFFL